MVYTIKASLDPSSIKRCYVDMDIEVECPEHKIKLKYDTADYLTHPEILGKEEIVFYCENCDDHWVLPITIESCKMAIAYDLDNLEVSQ